MNWKKNKLIVIVELGLLFVTAGYSKNTPMQVAIFWARFKTSKFTQNLFAFFLANIATDIEPRIESIPNIDPIIKYDGSLGLLKPKDLPSATIPII